MQSKNKDWFFYNGFSWSRVILRGGGDYRFQVAIKLTDKNFGPIELREVLISHTHWSELIQTGKDIWTHELPDHVYKHLEESYSKDRLNTLLHADLYPLIDWDRHRKVGKKFVPFAECIKEAVVPYTDISIAFEGTTELFLTEQQWFKKFQLELKEDVRAVGGFHHGNGQCDLLAYITYEMVSGKVILDVRSSNPDQDSIVRFQHHRSKDWAHEFNASINKMSWLSEEHEFCTLDLKEMVRRAAVYISSFNQ